MAKRFHTLLAELFRNDSVEDVARAAGLSVEGLIFSGDRTEDWFHVVNHAWRLDELERLCAHACARCPDDRRAIHDALSLEYPQPGDTELWAIRLDRTLLRESLKELKRTVTALMLVGPRGEGHMHFTEWVRHRHGQRRGPDFVRLPWPRFVGIDPQLGALAADLHEKCVRFGLRGLTPPKSAYSSDPEAWRSWGGTIARDVLDLMLQGTQPNPNVPLVVGCRHTIDRPTVQDAAVIKTWIELVWSAVASQIRTRSHAVETSRLYCVATFEAVTLDAPTIEAIRAVAGQTVEHVSIPALEPLRPVLPSEVVDWLADSSEFQPQGRDRDLPYDEHARRACKGAASPYESVIRYFSRDFQSQRPR